MELSPKQQAVELLKGAQRVLVVAHQNPDGDAIGSTLALTLALSKLGMEVTAAISDVIPSIFEYLPRLDTISRQISGGKEFSISIDIKDTVIDKLGYKTNQEENKLNIIITTKQGTIEPSQVNIGVSSSPYDVIVVLDTTDLDRLGQIYDQDPDLFFNVPVVNIDHHPSNEYFGKINWIDVTATSTSEMLVSLIEAVGSSMAQGAKSAVELIDGDIATALLTGITTDTGSFQNANTTPKSLTVAAQLVANGARQQEIIRHVFKTKSLSTLRLWGKALTKIQVVPEANFIYSTLLNSDFNDAKAMEEESSGVIDELMKSASGIDFALLVVERSGGVHGSLRAAQKGIDVSVIARIFGGGGHDMAAAFHLENTNIDREINRIVSKIKEYQVKQNELKTKQSAVPVIDDVYEDNKSDKVASDLPIEKSPEDESQPKLTSTADIEVESKKEESTESNAEKSDPSASKW